MLRAPTWVPALRFVQFVAPCPPQGSQASSSSSGGGAQARKCERPEGCELGRMVDSTIRLLTLTRGAPESVGCDEWGGVGDGGWGQTCGSGLQGDGGMEGTVAAARRRLHQAGLQEEEEGQQEGEGVASMEDKEEEVENADENVEGNVEDVEGVEEGDEKLGLAGQEEEEVGDAGKEGPATPEFRKLPPLPPLPTPPIPTSGPLADLLATNSEWRSVCLHAWCDPARVTLAFSTLRPFSCQSLKLHATFTYL